MCIKTLRDKNKVVGLSINGKNFKLDRQICHALGIEELKSKIDAKAMSSSALQAKNLLMEKVFRGSSVLMDIEVSYSEANEINSKTAKVEFKNKFAEISEEKRLEFTELLENFIDSLNMASKSHCEEVEKAMREIIKRDN
ncbi:MAG: hypothetical protein CME71_00275 [Halobacteriovorax sp.]|nr:hypothetical protein [Halobacteriovorax sp.]